MVTSQLALSRSVVVVIPQAVMLPSIKLMTDDVNNDDRVFSQILSTDSFFCSDHFETK